MPTPTVAIEHAEPGRTTPAQAADAFLRAAAEADEDDDSQPLDTSPVAGRSLEATTLEALHDEQLTRAEVRGIQSGYKNPDRFDQWVGLLQSRAAWADPIVLPFGEGLNIVATPAGHLVRCDCGHDFCDWRHNWKLHASIRVRDSAEALQEIYPRMAHCSRRLAGASRVPLPVVRAAARGRGGGPRLPGRPRVPAGPRGLLPLVAGA